MDARAGWTAGLVWLCGAGLTRAADLGDAVAGHAGLTYFDLMKRVVTDLAPASSGGWTGHAPVALQHIEGKDAKADSQKTVTINSVGVMPIPGAPNRIVLLADLGPSEGDVADANALALFALEPEPRLLDVVEVGSDRDVGFAGDKPAMLAPRAPLILISSEHDNSNQSYQSTEMIFIRHDRFQRIDSVFAFGDAACSYRRTQTPAFTTLASPGSYRALQVTIREKVTVSGEDCGEDDKPPAPHTSVYQATYRWDARRGRFVTRSSELNRLADEDQKRF